MMRMRTILAIVSVLFTPSINVQVANAMDNRAIMENAVDEMIAGKQSKKIDLECFFDEARSPLRFKGTYTTTSEYIDEGTGTEAVATTDKGLPPPLNAVFKRRRNSSKNNEKLFIYVKTDTRPTIYQIDKQLRIFAVYQQDPMTNPTPFTNIYAGTCWGVF